MSLSRRRLAFAALLLLAASHSSPKRISAELAGHAPSIAFDDRGKLHVAYIDDRGVIFHDLQSNRTVVVSPKDAHPDGRGEVGPLLTSNLVIVYANRTGEKWASTLVTQRSADGGRTWSPPRKVNDDNKPSSHSFADAVVNRDGNVVVSWLDSRSGHQGVRAAIVRRNDVTPNRSVDPVTCECCRIALLNAADGSVWIAYRDHAEGNIRNMVYAVSRDRGVTFSAPRTIADDRWSINGCPESGPRLTQTADGTVWAAWFNGGAPAIQLANFNGRAFTTPVRIASPGGGVTMVNHPEIGTLPDGRLLLLYEARIEDSTTIVARVADRAPIIVARNATGPRYARNGDRAAIAFTERRGGKEFVRVLDWRDALKD